MKELVFMIKQEDDSIINSYNGIVYEDARFAGTVNDRLERKYGVKVYKNVISDNTFYRYDVITNNNSSCLSVYRGKYDNGVKYEKIYSVTASPENTGILEEGDCDISFWHEFFGTCYGSKDIVCENEISQFSMNDDMVELRKVFPMELFPNPFIFFERYKKLKKYKKKHFDTAIFNIPTPKTNKNVGKAFDGKYINYVWQSEVVLENEVFFDLNILSGFVENGVIDVKEHHRIFFTSDYWYSPDGGDIGVLVLPNTYGNVVTTKMRVAHPELMIDVYNGKFVYPYILSKEFIPCFEILAKAGFSKLADLMLDNWYLTSCSSEKDYYETFWKCLNIWGKNDKEIFGFKLSKFKNFEDDACENCRFNNNVLFPIFVENIQKIIRKNEAALDHYGKVDSIFFKFLMESSDISSKTIEYMFSIGLDKFYIYRDYIRMCSAVNRYSGGLYPKKLEHEHDVMVTYMNQIREAKNNTIFENTVKRDSYQNYVWDGNSDDMYCILAPRVANDLVNESYQLSHCVRGYISNVASGYTKIYFLRMKDQKAKSLITIEVNNRDVIVQARGKYNRYLTKQETRFLEKWAIEKNLEIDYMGYRIYY